MSQSPGVAVGALLHGRPDGSGMTLDLLAGASGLDRRITSPYVQKTGLALAGFDEYLRSGRVLIFGESEIRFLESLSADERLSALQAALRRDFPCILITGGFAPPAELPLEAERAGVPVLQTRTVTPTAIARLSAFLADALAERTVVHAVLLDVLGLGVLLTGESGIGKSECALDLIVRGHRLVADDTVDVKRRTDTVLIGSCPDLTRHHMELRGLGIINVRELFGISSTRASKRIELAVHLERWEPGREYERLGLDDAFYELLDVKVPLIRMPVAPGRNIAILVEVAARNQLLRARGHHAARLLVERLNNALQEPGATDPSLDDDEDEDVDPGGVR
jgi:HPr kinase/phosphorylase